MRERVLNVFKRLTFGLSHEGSKHNQCQQRDGAEEEVRAMSRSRQEDWSRKCNKPIRHLFIKLLVLNTQVVTQQKIVMSK